MVKGAGRTEGEREKRCCGARLLTDRPVRGNCERKAGLVPIARSRRVLDQPYVVHEDIPSDSACRILVARIRIVYAEGDTGSNGYVGERDLVPIWRHGLKGNPCEVAPARMCVRCPDTVDACLRGGREIGSPARRRAHEHETHGSCRRTGRTLVIRLATAQDARLSTTVKALRSHVHQIPGSSRFVFAMYAEYSLPNVSSIMRSSARIRNASRTAITMR